MDLKLKFPAEQSKVEFAYAIWWELLNDAKIEFDPKASSAWKGTTKESMDKLSETIKSMNTTEKKEFFSKIISSSQSAIDNMNP